MVSDIKTFRVDAQFKGDQVGFDTAKGSFDFETAKKEVLRQFDEWRENEKPTIFSVNFGKINSVYIEDQPHYWYVQVLYCS